MRASPWTDRVLALALAGLTVAPWTASWRGGGYEDVAATFVGALHVVAVTLGPNPDWRATHFRCYLACFAFLALAVPVLFASAQGRHSLRQQGLLVSGAHFDPRPARASQRQHMERGLVAARAV